MQTIRMPAQHHSALDRPSRWAAVLVFCVICNLLVCSGRHGLAVAATPLPGQIIVDAEHPQWLMRAGGGHVFICGPGDPEGFLYRGRRRADGTRDGDQVALIHKLIRYGGNCIYMQIVRSHGGDGAADHNPFVDADPTKGLDPEILDQWEQWFDLMDEHQILIYLFFYDDSARIWEPGNTAAGRVGSEEKAFLEGIVRRFQHHRNLIWLVAEESEEVFSTQRVQAIARIIRAADDHGHLIGSHHHSGTTFKAWEAGGALNHFAMQYNHPPPAAHDGAVEAFWKSQGKYQVIYAENTAAEPTIDYAWAAAMGGTMPMLLGMDIASTSPETLRQCRFLQRFFETTDFYRMEPHDELAVGSRQWVLAAPPQSYIVYAQQQGSGLGIRDLPAGPYDLLWLDCHSGVTCWQRQLSLAGGGQRLARPSAIGLPCAVWLRRTSSARSVPPRPAESYNDSPRSFAEGPLVERAAAH